MSEGGGYNSENEVVGEEVEFVIEGIKNWKRSIELNYGSNYNLWDRDYERVYGYDVKKKGYGIGKRSWGVREYGYKRNLFNGNMFREY